MSRLRQNELNYVAVFLIEASWPGSYSWGRFEPRFPIRGTEWARSPHFNKSGNSARYGGVSYLLWDKLLAGWVENNAHYFGPSFPPMYHLDTCPLYRVIYPLQPATTSGRWSQVPPCDRCASARNGALRHPLLALTSHRSNHSELSWSRIVPNVHEIL
jgi:hypothetical protein